MSILNTRPTTITKSTGQEVTNNSVAQGRVISDGTNNRILVGYDKDGFGTGNDYGIKVSKPGYDVLTTGDSNIIMSSAYNLFKIVGTGTVSITHSASTTSIQTTIAHGLSFVPGFACYDYNGSDYIQMPVLAFLSGTSLDLQFEAWTNATNIVFYLYTPSTGASYGAGFTITARYYLTQETAS